MAWCLRLTQTAQSLLPCKVSQLAPILPPPLLPSPTPTEQTRLPDGPCLATLSMESLTVAEARVAAPYSPSTLMVMVLQIFITSQEPPALFRPTAMGPVHLLN